MSDLQSYQDIGRKHPVHMPIIGTDNRTVIVFITVNPNHRKPILAKSDAVETIRSAWKQADTRLVGRYVIMPGHIHLFCGPHDLAVPLKQWVKFWKSFASKLWPHPSRAACLAGGLLGHAIAQGRELRPEVGLRLAKSCSERACVEA